MDIVDPETRSRMMAGIGGKNTRPELVLRKALHRAGFRFRLHDRRLPGKPDLVLRKYRAAILVHGCFWHRHAGCPYATMPATRPDFWQEKFRANVERDRRNLETLRRAGWRTAVVWECGLRDPRAESTILEVADWLVSDSNELEIPSARGNQTASHELR